MNEQVTDSALTMRDGAAQDVLLHVTGLRVVFAGQGSLWGRGPGHAAVDGVSFSVKRGHTLGLIGESGSGKTTVCRVLAGLVKPTEGCATLDGMDLFAANRRRADKVRPRIQMIFQDPFSSLDPGLRTIDIVREPLRAQRHGSTAEQEQRVAQLLELVGLNAGYMSRYPHQMSGGQLQRVAIARALALSPDLLLADEPLSALDVSIQAQVSNLLMRLQRELGISFLFIGHDLAAVRRLSDSVAVMFNGRLMEWGNAEEVYGAPSHPYTLALMSAVPQPAASTTPRIRLNTRTSGGTISEGCRYRGRCWLYERLGRPERCASEDPVQTPSAKGRGAACHFSHEIPSQPEYSEVLGATGLG